MRQARVLGADLAPIRPRCGASFSRSRDRLLQTRRARASRCAKLLLRFRARAPRSRFQPRQASRSLARELVRAGVRVEQRRAARRRAAATGARAGRGCRPGARPPRAAAPASRRGRSRSSASARSVDRAAQEHASGSPCELLRREPLRSRPPCRRSRNRRDTSARSAPARTTAASPRPPTSSSIASTRIDLPAPVSPVSTREARAELELEPLDDDEIADGERAQHCYSGCALLERLAPAQLLAQHREVAVARRMHEAHRVGRALQHQAVALLRGR